MNWLGLKASNNRKILGRWMNLGPQRDRSRRLSVSETTGVCSKGMAGNSRKCAKCVVRRRDLRLKMLITNPITTRTPFFNFCEARPAVVLGMPTSLFISKMLTGTGGKQAFCLLSTGRIVQGVKDGSLHSPTCSAFSTLRRILEGLSGPGKMSSCPARGPEPVWKICQSIKDQYKNSQVGRTFGRNEVCSSMTELFRNFCTRQSLPWIA